MVVYFILKFSQPIRSDLVVKTLKEEAKLKKFGRLRVAHESITQIRSSSKASSSEGKVTDLLNDVQQRFL